MIEQLPNIIILNIIKSVDNNVDLICLLLTCKRLYYNIRQQYSGTLQFRHIRYLLEYHQPNEWLIKSIKTFNLQSFKSLFNNALSNQILVSDNKNKQSFNSHLVNNNNDNNNLTIPPPDNISLTIYLSTKLDDIIAPSTTTSIDINSQVNTPLPSTLLQGIDNLRHLSISTEYTSAERICKLPDTLKSFTIYYDKPSCVEGGDVFPLGLETLSLSSNFEPITLNSLGLGKLKSLKSLDIAPVIITESLPLFLSSPSSSSPSSSYFLPISLTSLYIVFECTVPSNFFQSLVSLESITMRLTCSEIMIMIAEPPWPWISPTSIFSIPLNCFHVNYPTSL
ncbi:hypothetical protein DFA_00890 [Cavenderia fasciculata]|uniref:F-box domain-containing protein n=1 Tax=Cavenderia fasciculata TaxID=261658 RepID=F4PUE9_CACFS|nr:uncharacterized protein DFA_00890 [Cavenderia fasciculata]EGG21021.1 hypothetical protein DFA_00890 [Cavenderia fasciculata]|eukprot:XP_004358871.1 hypothetical protein DFA_00890 [Cavenderia fasciculata]